MKKTETMSILLETNKMLREEKEKMEQELQQTQAKVSGLVMRKWSTDVLKIHSIVFLLWVITLFEYCSWEKYSNPDVLSIFQLQKLESDITPMQQANSELSEKSGMLQVEKKILEEEIKRWKARTQVREKTTRETSPCNV